MNRTIKALITIIFLTFTVTTQLSAANGDFVLDCSVQGDWSMLTEKDFILNGRGFNIQTNLRYTQWELEPGFGLMFRYDGKMGIAQLPILFSLTFSDYVKAYAGPVITFGSPEVPGSDYDAHGSFFPGIIGLSFQSPTWNVSSVKMAVVQDIQYTVFNETDNSALSTRRSIASGLVLSTGFRFLFPMNF